MRPSRLPLAAGIAVVACALALALKTPALLLLIGVPIAVMLLLRRRLQVFWLSPVWLLVFALTTVGLLGYAVYGSDQHQPELLLTVSQQTSIRTLDLLALSSASLAVGAACVLLLQPSERFTGAAKPLRFGPIAKAVLVGLALLPLVLAVIYLDSLLRRTTYLRGISGSLVGASGQLTLAGVVALGYLSAEARGARRILYVVAAVVETLVLFSLASRQFALAPAGFAAGIFGYGLGPRSRIALAAGAALGVLLIPIPLYLRVRDAHGLVPYVAALPHVPYDIQSLKDSVANLVLGFPVIGITAFRSPAVSVHDLLVSVNPAPGHLAGWYRINDRLRISLYYPYAGVGEIRSVGLGAVVGVWFLIGAVLGHLDRRVGALLHKGRQALALTLVGLSALFGVYVTQYNLRNASRPLWYALVVDLSATVVMSTTLRSRRPAAPRSVQPSRMNV